MDSGRDQFKPGPRRGAAGGLGGFELLGAIVFLVGCLPAVALGKAAARGTDLGAEGLAQLLVGKLVSARFMPEKAAALQAMAWVAEPGALDALLAVLKRRRIGGSRVDDTSRAFAIAALGAIGSQRPVPFNAAWAQDIVWNAAPPSLHEAENGGGVLDLF